MKTLKSRSGAILLETLIVLPVYLVLIGGIMWIGDLILAKQQAIIGDRYGAWNRGNMHRGTFTGLKDEIQNNFFPADMHPHQKAFLFPPKAIHWNRWWDIADATLFVNMKMPAWTKGWLASASQVHLGESIPQMLGVQGRDVASGKNHSVLMRTYRSYQDEFVRNWSGRSLASGAWDWGVYKEKWPMELHMVLPVPVMTGEEYERYGPYVAISD